MREKNLNIKNKKPRTIVEKLKYVRIAQGYSQEALGFEVDYEPSMIGHIERGEAQYSVDRLKLAKEFLGIDGMPLTDNERQGFRNKLYVWLGLIKEHELDAAKEMQKELSPITILDFDVELNMLYGLFYCKLLVLEGNLNKAGKVLDDLESLVDEVNDECLYHFYYTKGMFLAYTGQYRKALESYNEAKKKLMVDNIDEQKRLLFNIAHCYFELGHSFRVVVMLNDYYYLNDSKDNINLSIGNTLALCWIRVGFYKRATEMLNKCYIAAMVNKDDQDLIGRLLHNYGCLYRKTKDWGLSVEYFDKAFPYFKEGSIEYLENLYQKTCSLIESRDYSFCDELIAEGKELSAKAENKKYSILFESLKHRMTLNNDKISDYIETVTIPYLLEALDNYRALEYVELLRERYGRKRAANSKKSLLMADLARKIYIEIHEGGEL